MSELDSRLFVQIQNLCSEGDGLAEDENYAAAIEKYWAAWDLLPKPQQSWEAATWILGAIGDANYLNDDFAAGKDNLSVAITCPDGLGNPFLHFRLGQCLYELSELDRAADELARAYMVAGLELFENEDPKYLAFLKTRLKPPPSGW